MQSTNEIVTPETRKSYKWRALISYWILGLCNNYGYVVMLTAASDIIDTNQSSRNHERKCTYMSTGAILLADVIPSMLAKFLAPFLPFFVNTRVFICVTMSAAGFLMVAFSGSIALSLLGVIATSFCSGLGEATYLQYSSHYERNVVSTWSSGTGGAGVIGALSYSILQRLGFETTLLLMLVIPITMAITFWLILPKPYKIRRQENLDCPDDLRNSHMSTMDKIRFLPSLLKYMIPFGLVYLFEYFINQGTFELITFDDIVIDHKDQYRWLQVAYQVGVFLSRSSVSLFHIKQIWLMCILQLINVILFTTEVIYFYIPSYWVIVGLTLWEGLLGGAAYVNTYYRISTEVAEDRREFSMAITSFADSIGITLAGLLAIYAHNAICSLPIPKNN